MNSIVFKGIVFCKRRLNNLKQIKQI